MKKVMFSILIGILVSLLYGRISVAVSNNSNGNPPQELVQTVVLQAGEGCPDFGVELNATKGKIKTIILSGSRHITPFAGAYVSVTNLSDPAKTVTFNIAGSVLDSTNPDGTINIVSLGRGLFWDPQIGLVMTIGVFKWITDANGNILTPLAGQGQVIDLCPLVR